MTSLDAARRMIEAGVIEVRPDGTVWKLRNMNATPLDAPRRMETRSSNGYLSVKVCLEGRQYAMTAHRLAWTVLRRSIPAGMEINHKDGVKTNNHPDNLEVVTGSENNLHAYRTLGRKLPKSIPKPVLAQVAPRAKELRAAGLSFSEIGRRLGVAQTTVFRAVNLP